MRILAILKRGRDTFLTIIRNPVGFLGNLLRAVGQGVRQFMNNILQHLQQGVIAWLTGPVARAGIQMPQQWDLRGIIGFVMQILGLTWDRIRQKLARLMGERAVATLESGFQLIQEIRERGLVQALRDRVTEFFGQLREAALGSIRSFIQQRLVMAGIQQLLSLLSPVGAVIQAIIKTYTTIQFFIQRISQILDLVESIVNSIASIASSAIGTAAAFIERTMARTIPIILDFLARFIGLGDVGGQVQRTIQGLQARVDAMLDRAVDWIRSMAQRLGRLITGQGAAPGSTPGATTQTSPNDGELGESLQFTAGDEGHRLWIEVRGETAEVMLASTAKPLSQHLSEFRSDARDIEDTTTKNQVLGWIQQALPLARAIERDARRAASRQIDTPQRNTLDNQIETNETALRPILANILNVLGVRVPTQITSPIDVHFTAAPGLNLSEYARQLGLQQQAINNMVVEDWLTNRMRFAERRASSGARGGRHPQAQQVQDNARTVIRQRLILRLTQGINASTPETVAVNADPYLRDFVLGVYNLYSPTTQRNGLAVSTATAQVDAWLQRNRSINWAGQAVLHSPDQIAGGRHTDITGLGAADVNSDIGANWGGLSWLGKPTHLANNLERSMREAMRRLNVRRAFWRQVRMNVNLHT